MSELREVLNLLAEGQNWTLEAACRDMDPDLFFPVGTKGPAADQANRAKAVCFGCPVRAQCLNANMEASDGIFGGLDEHERRALRRRAAHEMATIKRHVPPTVELEYPSEPPSVATARALFLDALQQLQEQGLRRVTPDDLPGDFHAFVRDRNWCYSELSRLTTNGVLTREKTGVYLFDADLSEIRRAA